MLGQAFLHDDFIKDIGAKQGGNIFVHSTLHGGFLHSNRMVGYRHNFMNKTINNR